MADIFKKQVLDEFPNISQELLEEIDRWRLTTEFENSRLYGRGYETTAVHFAEWQKEQDDKKHHNEWMNWKGELITACGRSESDGYHKGIDDGMTVAQEDIMKNAIEGTVTNAGGEFGYDVVAFRFDENHTYTILIPHKEGRKYGDKIKMAIFE